MMLRQAGRGSQQNRRSAVVWLSASLFLQTHTRTRLAELLIDVLKEKKHFALILSSVQMLGTVPETVTQDDGSKKDRLCDSGTFSTTFKAESCSEYRSYSYIYFII